MRTFVTKQPSNQDSVHQKPVRATPVPVVRSLSIGLTGSAMLQRKPDCACGGGCPRCQEAALLQTKLKISEPGDEYEREADLIADRVMRMPEPSIQRQMEPEEDEEEGMVQRKAIARQDTSEVPSIVPEVLNSPAQLLDPATRTFMESRFGHDFSQVQVHTDAKAAESAQAINALAYTVRKDIVFGARQYTPKTTEGKKLLAHELTHVVQQSLNRIPIHLQRQRVSPPSVSTLPPMSQVSPYAALPEDLLQTLHNSFNERKRGLADASQNLENGFCWGKCNPQDLWQALEQFGVADINTMVQIYKLSSTIGEVWNHVHSIQKVWTRSSRGIKFNGSGIQELVKSMRQNPSLCKDTKTAQFLHKGQECWREVKAGGLGLHICLDKSFRDSGVTHEIHIDLHQTVNGKKLDGICDYNMNPFGIWGQHMMDLMNRDASSGYKPSVFERFDLAHQQVKDLKQKLRQGSVDYSILINLEAQLNQITPYPYMQQQAISGLQGENQAEQAKDSLLVIVRTLKQLQNRYHGRRLGETRQIFDFSSL
jgi:Domain of unknown function (DUF4157)